MYCSFPEDRVQLPQNFHGIGDPVLDVSQVCILDVLEPAGEFQPHGAHYPAGSWRSAGDAGGAGPVRYGRRGGYSDRPAGSVVVDAQVELHHVDLGTTLTRKTNSSGQ